MPSGTGNPKSFNKSLNQVNWVIKNYSNLLSFFVSSLLKLDLNISKRDSILKVFEKLRIEKSEDQVLRDLLLRGTVSHVLSF